MTVSYHERRDRVLWLRWTRRVARHQAALRSRVSPGKGSSFRFTCPYTPLRHFAGMSLAA